MNAFGNIYYKWLSKVYTIFFANTQHILYCI